MAEPQGVGGISVPLSIDRSRWSAELKAARQEYDQFRNHISRGGGVAGGGGVGRVAPGVVGPARGVQPPAGPPLATVGNVSPRFAVSQGSVRDMRIEINKQLRTFASQGEAVAVPIKLGRVPYAAIRNEISTGIGLVPIKLTLDPGAIAHLRGLIVGAIGATGGGGRVAPGQTSLPTPRRRASGGPVYMQRGGRTAGASVYGYDLSAAEIRPHQRAYIDISGLAAARPLTAWGGNIWYPGRRRALLEQAKAAGQLTYGQGIGPLVRSAKAAVAVPSIASPGIPDKFLASWTREILDVAQANRRRFQGADPASSAAISKELVVAIQRRTRLPPGRSYRDLAKAMQVALGHRTWQDVVGSSPKVNPFLHALFGKSSALVADSHHIDAGRFLTEAAINAAGSVGKPNRLFPEGRPTRTRAIMLEASRRAQAQFSDVWPSTRGWQAGVWGEHFVQGTGTRSQPIENAFTNIVIPKSARRDIPPGWAAGERGILTKMQRGGRARGFCSVCRTSVRDPLLHRSTAKHLKNVRGPSRGTGDYLRGRQAWMNALRDPSGDEELYEERGTSYPGGKWHPGMQRGGRASLEELMARAPTERGYDTTRRRQRGPFGFVGGSLLMYGGRRLEAEDLGPHRWAGQSEPGQQDLWAPPITEGGRFTKVDPRWLPKVNPARFRHSKMMAGGPTFRQVSPELFHETISSASNVVRGSGRRVGETVSTYPLEEYAAMRTYLNETRTAGYAIKPDGDLVSVFNVGGKGAGKSAIRSAIQRGATKLDAFDEVGTMGAITHPVHPHDVQKNLPRFYGQFGFREVGRDPWDPQYAPEGWTGGTPDVVYMARKARRSRMQLGGKIKRLGSLKAFREFAAENPDLYSRWTPSIRRDMEPGRTSATLWDRSDREAGISTHPVPMFPGTPYERLFSPKYDLGPAYGEWGYRDRDRLGTPGFKRRRMWLMQGTPGGAGGEGEPIFAPESIKPVAAVSRRAVEEYWEERGRPRRFAGGGWIARMGGTPRGEGASLSLRVADPNGLHLRPAAALAKVGQMAELSGNPIRVTNATAGRTIGYPATGSVIGWTTLLGAPRRGHKLNISVGGTDTERVVNLLEKLIGFEGPEKTGQSYSDFHSSLGVVHSSVATLDKAEQARRTKFAAGGAPDDAGMYIVNEIGREKFVPDRMAHLIPPDVFEQLPKRQEGGITEIEGHGAQLWQAPEDGWIIPARLAGKVPARQYGTPRGRRGPRVSPGQEGFDFPEQIPPQEETWGGIFRRRQPRPEAQFTELPTEPRSTWGGVFRRQRPAEPAGPAGPRETWSGAMGGQGSALRGVVQGVAQGFAQGIQNLFSRRGPATAGAGPIRGPGGPADFVAGAPGYENTAPPPHGTPPDFDPVTGMRLKPAAVRPTEQVLLRQRGEMAPGGRTPEEIRMRAAARTERVNRIMDRGAFAGAPDPLRAAMQEARAGAAAVRGLTGPSGFGGWLGATLGGGQARRESMMRGQALMRSYEAMLPEGYEKGTDTILALRDETEKLTKQYESERHELSDLSGEQDIQIKNLDTLGGRTEANAEKFDALRDSMRSGAKDIDALTSKQKIAGRIQAEANRDFDKAAGGAIRNVLTLTAGGFAFSAAMQGIGIAMDLGQKALAPLIDEMGGFSSTSIRVTSDIAKSAREMGGNVEKALGTAALEAGIGPTALPYLTQTLTGPVTAKAGAMAQQQQSDLFRAAMGANVAPAGLRGGYGGIGGGGLLAEFFGGGKGIGEIIAGDVQAMRTEAIIPSETTTSPEGLVAPNITPENATQAYDDLTRSLTDNNEAYQRGTKAIGENADGVHLATKEQLGLTDALEIERRKIQSAGLGDDFKKMAENDVFLVNAQNEQITAFDTATKYLGGIAAGRQVPTLGQIKMISAGQLEAGRQVGRFTREQAIEREIPFATGMRVAAEPFINVRNMIPGIRNEPPGSRLSNEAQRLNREGRQIEQRAQAAIETQAKFIDVWAGPQQGGMFRTMAADVTQLGKQIASLNAGIMNRQAQLSFTQYSNNIRIINRSIADARGLLSGQGGPRNLGAVQRQQFELQRESQRLQMQLSQRQINFQVALAGFQAPGVTPEETQARVKEAQIEAGFAQRQLNIQKEAFPLEFTAFIEQARRSVVDLEAQRTITRQSFELEREQIVVQQKIARKTIRMGELQDKMQALVVEAQGAFNNTLNVAADAVARLGDEAGDVAEFMDNWVDSQTEPTPARRTTSARRGAPGMSAYVSSPTQFIAGDAGSEQVYVLRNPRAGTIMPPAGGGGGGGDVITINISGNTFSNMSAEEVAEEIAVKVEKRLGRKARLVGAH